MSRRSGERPRQALSRREQRQRYLRFSSRRSRVADAVELLFVLALLGAAFWAGVR